MTMIVRLFVRRLFHDHDSASIWSENLDSASIWSETLS